MLLTAPPELVFPEAKYLAVDIETTGLSPKVDHIVGIAVSDGTESFFLDVRPYQPGQAITDEFIRWWLLDQIYTRTIIAHNAAFDLAFLHEKYDVDYPASVWDTQVAEQLIYAGEGKDFGYKLLHLAQRYCGIEMDKTLQTSFTLEGEISPEQVEYACLDTSILPGIAEEQRRKISARNLGKVWKLERALTPIYAEMFREGIQVDRQRLEELLAKEQKLRDELAYRLEVRLTPHVEWLRLSKYEDDANKLSYWQFQLEGMAAELEEQWRLAMSDEGGDSTGLWETKKWDDTKLNKKDGKPEGMRRFVKAKLTEWRKENPRPAKPKQDISPINLNSSEQVLAALQELGITPIDPTKKQPSISEDALLMVLPDASPEIRDTVIKPLLDYKEHEKLRQLAESLGPKLDPFGRAHGNNQQIGTATGRPSMSQPNLLQIPKGSDFRRCFVPAPGHLFIVADYSQMELRLMAQMAPDARMRQAFINNEDLHTVTAAGIFTNGDLEKVTKDQRGVGKTENFLVQYGGGAETLRQNLAVGGTFLTKEQCQEAIRTWGRTYPGVTAKRKEWGELALKQGYTETALGRKRYFDLEGTRYDRGERARVMRAGANHPIQGTCADIVKQAMVTIHQELGGLGIGGIRLNVYDEIVVEIHEDYAQAALLIVKQAMLDAARTVLTDVPIQVDAVISTSWNEGDALAA